MKGLLASLPLLAACAALDPPETELATAKKALDDAAPLAMAYAAPEWSQARSKLERARESYEKRDWRRSRGLAEEAELDARYAQALAEGERAREP
ncbi:MAG: hypothetical protein ABR570_11715 [Burkholderiales bacterium]